MLENPALLDDIPDGAEVVLLPKDDPELYRINLAAAQREVAKPAGPIIFIEIDALRPPRSRLVNPHLTLEPGMTNT